MCDNISVGKKCSPSAVPTKEIRHPVSDRLPTRHQHDARTVHDGTYHGPSNCSLRSSSAPNELHQEAGRH